MEKIKFIEIKISIDINEDNLISFEKTFLFDIEEFKNCESIEEVRDMFIDKHNENYDYIEVKTFKNLQDRSNDSFFEYLGE